MGNLLVHVDITPEILAGVSCAARLLGQYEGHRCGLKSHVKRAFFLDNLHANLALEGSTLSVAEVDALLRGESVGAVESQLVQARAFIATYQKSSQFSVLNKKDLLTAFLLMNEGHTLDFQARKLSADSWNARIKESLELIGVLLEYIRDDKATHPAVKAAVFHYQMFHIRPFDGGNDAVARLWHRLLLGGYHRLFIDAPFESLLKRNQQKYIDALGSQNNHEGQQRFVEFALSQLVESLKTILANLELRLQRVEERLTFARMHFGDSKLTRKQYMELFQTIGPATASRDLKAGLDSGILIKQGRKARTVYYFTQDQLNTGAMSGE